MLMPAGVLIVLVLAAITMDLSLVHLARREVVAAAEAAANDAVTLGLSERAYRSGGGYVLDRSRVEHAVAASLARHGVADELAAPPEVTIVGTTVEVRLTTLVEYVFGRALPGVEHHTFVSATGSATPISR